jgi:hypothetical protein
MTKPIKRIAVTGGAGQIAYSLLFRIASGDLLGPDQPIALHILELESAMPALKGVVMEIEDQRRTGAEGVAHQLERDLQRNPLADSFSWKTGSAKDIAWESHQLAQTRIYRRLSIPKQSCLTGLEGCDAAPPEISPTQIDAAYLAEAASVARTQLMRSGIRLAKLLNLIWP